MLDKILWLIMLTLLPFLELRASIPYGIIAFGKEQWLMVFLIAVIVNIILGVIIFYLLNTVVHVFLRVKWINKIWEKIVEKTQKKIHPYVEKYGFIGLGLFIGVPLPGSGVYSGALGAYLLGVSYKDFIKASVLGVLIAGIIVTIVMVTGASGFELFLKKV